MIIKLLTLCDPPCAIKILPFFITIPNEELKLDGIKHLNLIFLAMYIRKGAFMMVLPF